MSPGTPTARVSVLSLVRAVLIVLAAVAGSAVLPHLTPTRPDLVVLVVVAAALMRGPYSGALVGLGAGWVVDLVPPGGDPLGASALLYAAAGAVAGAGRRFGTWSPMLPVLATTAAALTLLAGRGLVAAASTHWVHLPDLGWTLLVTVALGLVGVPLLIRLERALMYRRLG